MALLDHGEAIPASSRPVGAAGLAGATHKIRVARGVLQNTGAQHRSNRFRCPTWPVHQPAIRLPPVQNRQNRQNRRQGLRPGGLRAVALVASGSPSCSSRRQDSGIRRGVVGTRRLAWLCFFPVRGLLRCFGLAIGDNGLMR